MVKDSSKLSASAVIEASAPCRIDMGGTLDIPTFYYPLRHLSPCTFNIALELRTRVRLKPFRKGMVRISSTGFKDAEFAWDAAPFDHPLGLMFATATYFGAQGIHVEIESQSPPRSALGGSSVAAVALAAALSKLSAGARSSAVMNRRALAVLAYQIEQSVAGVPCGIQDQLAAAFGGVNAWHWLSHPEKPVFRRKIVVPKNFHRELEKHLILAYCGNPHLSKDINARWVKQFVSGKYRRLWTEIIACTRQFITALAKRDFQRAAVSMNRETAIRRELTPDVLDRLGGKLVDLALKNGCGARFTGAGGGGCVWALGEIESIDRLRPLWEECLSVHPEARLLETGIDSRGLMIH